ncbi:sugar porter family MFS transporter [Hyalangium minutum]|uniref:Glucose/mannose:H+ symporter GlcP n=1 Tax=Hyalangium minutum TaxID=394096 RepID=A0A085W7D6_9BACT|nr:sugar porter family MFS transporter [Hyalangium minutum]KFE63599.1 Glucose/mannose:H+ symporter GlcP [Hyalangium minutum]
MPTSIATQAGGQPTIRPQVSVSRTILMSTVAALGGFLFGFDTAVINGTISAVQATFQASEWVLGLTVSAALVGSAVGAFSSGHLADRLGRPRTMVMASVLFLISALGSGLAGSLWSLGLWRLVGGAAIGMASVIAPAYIAEISPAHLRGRLGSLQQMAIVIGIFAALMSDYALATQAGSANSVHWLGLAAWRWMFFSAVPPALLYGVGALLIPESPRHLVARGRETEALKVLQTIVGDLAPSKLVEIRGTIHTTNAARLRDLRGPRFGLLPVVWVGIVLAMLQQFVGINVIFYYSSVLWQAVGFSEQSSLAITVITSITNIVTTVLAILCVDRFGRKPLLIVGSVGMALTLGVLAYLFGTAGLDVHGNPVLHGSSSVLALICANLYVFCFGFSWGPVVWVMLGEMFPNRIRAVALALAAAAQWVANFAVSATFPTLQSAGLGLAYGLYTAAAVLSLLFTVKYIRETKGKELEHIEHET